MPKIQQDILDKELQEFLDNDVIELADTSTPGFYSPVFLREKPRHDLTAPIKYRVIIDLSNLNLFVHKIHFKMESTNSIRSTLQVGDHFFSIDLTMAYNTVPMAPQSRKYLRFWWNGRAYQFKALCFGLSSAPWIFSLIMSEMSKYLHKCAVGCICYLDDVLFKDNLLPRLVTNQPLLLYFVQSCGWIINFTKSMLDITQREVYVGVDYDLSVGTVYPPQDRWIKLQSKITKFLTLHKATGHQWSSLMGTITSCQDLTPLGRLMARDLQIHLNRHWTDRKNPHLLIPVTAENKQSLVWWTKVDNVMCGAPLQPPQPTIEIWSDASHIGFGGNIIIKNTNINLDLSGSWTPVESSNHINYLELLAVQKCLFQWENLITNQSVLIHVDNTTVLHYINKKSGSRSPTLHHLCHQVLLWCHSRNIHLKAVHIQGKLNIQSDYLSRKGSIIPTEWSLHPSILQRINLTWLETPQVDLFATKLNAKLPLYFSPVPDPAALGLDALSQDWSNLIGYAYPPPAIITQVLNKLDKHPSCLLYLIAPNWPRMTWFPHLLQLLVDIPRSITVFPKLLRQPQTAIFHQNPSVFNLHVFKLSSSASRQEAFLQTLQTPSAVKTGHLQTLVMNDTGLDTWIGVKNSHSIHSTPL